MEKQLILASASPRRSQLLSDLGLCFDVVASGVDEQLRSEVDPKRLVDALSKDKAYAVSQLFPNAIVIGADTVVSCKGNIYGKPMDELDAVRMLTELNGQVHTVYTGVCVAYGADQRIESSVAATSVSMRPLDARRIHDYVATREPLDKAGAYAIQGIGSLLIERIEGCYFNVVGLPLSVLDTLLSSFGVDLLSCSKAAKSR